MKLFELQSPAEVTELENQLDRMFASLGINVTFSRHFVERLVGREKGVSVEEVVNSFSMLKVKYKNRLIKAKKAGGYTAVLRDFDHELNTVFSIRPPKNPGDDAVLTNITIKQKDPTTFVTNADGGEDLKVGSAKPKATPY